MDKLSRRDAVKASAGAVAGLAAMAAMPGRLAAAVHTARRGKQAARIRFAVIGANHNHIYGQVGAATRGGGEFAAYYVREPEIRADFAKRYPNVKAVADERAILEDPSIQLVLSSIVPAERAPLGIRVMRHGKDYMADKPGITTLAQLADVRRVQAETRRIYSICYSERFENAATVRAAELVRAGAIGDVVSTVGLGPHRVTPATRPAWFWDPTQYGGIITDIASHQFDQFLHFTGSTRAEIVAAQVGNTHHREHPAFQDVGDAMVRGDGGSGYVHVNWFTPDGLPTWGDTRLTVYGSAGYLEVRKNVDIAGARGANHLIVVDNQGVRRIDCSRVALPYGPALVDDVLHRTETAMTQAHCFLAMELALEAQERAERGS